jgi:hypothetical protein
LKKDVPEEDLNREKPDFSLPLTPKPGFRLIFYLVLLVPAAVVIFLLARKVYDAQIREKVIDRLKADSRAAEVIVTKTELEEKTGKILTTIKFLEYAVDGRPLSPRYFTFYGNIIQFQALVIRFRDGLVEAGDRVKGKSAYVFLKAFVLADRETQIFPITNVYDIPRGYKIEGLINPYEETLWREFWNYALNPDRRAREGIKNAQIEAPGSLFLPGTIYTIRIEHDGGMRIDAQPIPHILRGEKIE